MESNTNTLIKKKHRFRFNNNKIIVKNAQNPAFLTTKSYQLLYLTNKKHSEKNLF